MFIIKYFVAVILVAIAYLYISLMENKIYTSQVYVFGSKWLFEPAPTSDPLLFSALKKNAIKKFKKYYEMQENYHLSYGLIVNRDHLGQITSECDSLLFSSLRYVALKKIGLHSEAKKAWSFIEKSKDTNGQSFVRHPLCRHSTSRDMMIGIIAALIYKPNNSEIHLNQLIRFIENNYGFFHIGRPDVSFTSPGIGFLMRKLGDLYSLPSNKIPLVIRKGFKTNSLDVLFSPVGYRLHLIGLTLWLEMEIQNRKNQSKGRIKRELYSGELKELSKKIYVKDPYNLFFKFLYLKSHGKLSKESLASLLSNLIHMPQFPEARLPKDCDRKADYLWQRQSKEYFVKKSTCHETYSGVDFQLLTAIILGEEDQYN